MESQELENLSKLIHNEIYVNFYNFSTTVFLCGAHRDNQKSLRYDIEENLFQSPDFFRYEVFYPEDLFEELLFGSQHQDLLSLENILADSVDVVILILEGAGAISELGAFASNEKLRKN